MITKPLSPDAKQPVISVRLDRKTYEQLKRQAQTERRSLGSLARIIIEDVTASRSSALSPHVARNG